MSAEATCYLCWNKKPRTEFQIISSSYGNVCWDCVEKNAQQMKLDATKGHREKT